MEPSLALYRRYRPETFAEVIGQEHVTEPLRAALAADRTNHAYLFSGPRGCGKTTSARILARTMNCAQAPVADPCGECDSCRDLARGGPGSIDVIEIDAATHNGVDDARDLRERAFFAPVRDRYKIYVIDEAHMVTTAAFNALLKLVEEPPEHLKFVFATTEPEKVIPTIRSRTHHYPFRLIPPRTLSSYLSQLCEREGVAIDAAALPLVVRAGGGSARDTLSVLDQLIGGAGPAGVTYDVAVGLLGYTPDSLLDEVVDGFAAGDGSAVFSVVDKVIETGQDPRRFTEDVLRRLRDLVIVAAVPDAPASGLIDVAVDQAERLVAQAARFGHAELVRAADLLADGLTEMRGATAPRLLLELICARVLLPGADDDTSGLAARLDRIERRLALTSGDAGPDPVVEEGRSPALRDASSLGSSATISKPPDPVVEQRSEASASRPLDNEPEPPPVVEEGRSPVLRDASSLGSSATISEPPDPVVEQRSEASASRPPDSQPQPASTTLGLADVRRLWPDVLERIKSMRRFTWMMLSNEAQVIGVDERALTLGFKNAGARSSFAEGGSEEVLRQALIDLVGVEWRIEAVMDPSAQPGATPPPVVTKPAVVDQPSAAAAKARESIEPTRPPGVPTQPTATPEEQQVDRDDPDLDDSGLRGAELLQRELGATVIEDLSHD